MTWEAGDLDGDRGVGILDLGIVAANYGKGVDGEGKSGGYPPLIDYDSDGKIGIDDVRKYLDEYGGS